jgi:hypothetical protein
LYSGGLAFFSRPDARKSKLRTLRKGKIAGLAPAEPLGY